MQSVFAFIFHAFLVLGIAGLGFFIFEGVVTTSDRLEKMARVISVGTGIFLYGSAKAMNVTLTEWITRSVEGGSWFTFLSLGAVFPSIFGLLTAKYVVHYLKSADFIALRVILFMGSLILLQFCDLYIVTGLSAGLAVTRGLAPNLLFLTFFGLYIIFRYKPRSFDKK